MSQDDLRTMAFKLEQRVYDQAVRVPLAALPEDALCWVVSGMAHLSYAAPGGWEGSIKLLAEGDVLGVESFWDPSSHPEGSFQPLLDELVMWVLYRKDVPEALWSHPDLLRALMRLLAEERDAARKMMVMMS